MAIAIYLILTIFTSLFPIIQLINTHHGIVAIPVFIIALIPVAVVYALYNKTNYFRRCMQYLLQTIFLTSVFIVSLKFPASKFLMWMILGGFVSAWTLLYDNLGELRFDPVDELSTPYDLDDWSAEYES